ncbi:MAG: bifunctional salicylyl-CoA 5-hydroxylase/oxidoreductase [Planctomycetes bacterium]|nr:bifunctional salicylyl-CoA 5-hydroxylase/oxidoreductase [Planctomycetota bacterium]
MKIVCIGGGPAGLYFSILMKKAHPRARIVVHERNKHDDTFGWGVVFSDETLSNFEAADPESFAEIRKAFVSWGDIETWYGGQCVRSSGHGFVGIARRRLLWILHRRAQELGVDIFFEHEVTTFEEHLSADLVVACDGVNSAIRTKWAEHFQPTIGWGKCRFAWLGTQKELKAFTFLFRENEHGLFQVHAYPFQKGFSTFILECHEETWKRAGLDTATEEQTLRYGEKLFADHLDGHALEANRSVWRSFPTIACAKWAHENVVLMGDAAHTAHFSIGSGTKLAMEDAITLAQVFAERGTSDVRGALAEYQTRRAVDVLKIQKAAQTSREWFENSRRYLAQPPLQFQFNLMTRSKRITWENLAARDPKLVDDVREWYARSIGAKPASDGRTPVPAFTPFKLRELELANRIVVSPMCQYSAVDGTPTDWHLVHLGSRAVGGASLVIGEATAVTRDGRISHGCTGIWNDAHTAAWKRIVDFAHTHSRSKIGLQLAHAGRKASCSLPWEGDAPLRDASAWQTIGPSPAPFKSTWHVPREMTRADMDVVRDAFVAAAVRAQNAGFDLIELHMAHGYLLSSFLSPKANARRDEYGGSRENRMRLPLEVFDAVRAAWPKTKPISVRISASDWLDDAGGWTIDDSVAFARELKAHGCDVIDVSSGGNTPESRIEYGRMYQVPFAERIRAEAAIPAMAVGGIQSVDHVNTLVAAGRADLCAIARGHLSNPYLTLAATHDYGFVDGPWPNQYAAVKPRPRN